MSLKDIIRNAYERYKNAPKGEFYTRYVEPKLKAIRNLSKRIMDKIRNPSQPETLEARLQQEEQPEGTNEELQEAGQQTPAFEVQQAPSTPQQYARERPAQEQTAPGDGERRYEGREETPEAQRQGVRFRYDLEQIIGGPVGTKPQPGYLLNLYNAGFRFGTKTRGKNYKSICNALADDLVGIIGRLFRDYSYEDNGNKVKASYDLGSAAWYDTYKRTLEIEMDKASGQALISYKSKEPLPKRVVKRDLEKLKKSILKRQYYFEPNFEVQQAPSTPQQYARESEGREEHRQMPQNAAASAYENWLKQGAKAGYLRRFVQDVNAAKELQENYASQGQETAEAAA